MPAFLQQLPALLGVVTGAFGSCPAVVQGYRARFRRERAVRWEERRPAVCSGRTAAGRARAGTGPGREALLDQRRTGRKEFCAAAREDLALPPPGHSARWALAADPGGQGQPVAGRSRGSATAGGQR
ncbi:hypothetical protein [Streptomyces sp. NPDC058731]|uniref:hypothetical protein n=1 Tax=Streptomyces sp. NPDC058731 TaxID=3346613 RepID=UPI0036D0B81C